MSLKISKNVVWVSNSVDLVETSSNSKSKMFAHDTSFVIDELRVVAILI